MTKSHMAGPRARAEIRQKAAAIARTEKREERSRPGPIEVVADPAEGSDATVVLVHHHGDVEESIRAWNDGFDEGWAQGSADRAIVAAIIGLGAGIVLGLFIAALAFAAPRPAPEPAIPADATSVQPASRESSRLDLAQELIRAPSLAARSAEPGSGSGGGAPLDQVTRSGIASHMGRTQGPGYLALPIGPGHRVRLCGAGGCIVRTSTDAGPDLAMQRAGRIADLYVGDFERICGVPASFGLCEISWMVAP